MAYCLKKISTACITSRCQALSAIKGSLVNILLFITLVDVALEHLKLRKCPSRKSPLKIRLNRRSILHNFSRYLGEIRVSENYVLVISKNEDINMS